MSSSRYPDNRYPRDRDRERSPYRDRRPSGYGGGYPPRGSDSTSRQHLDSSAFSPRDVPRGPKSLVDVPRTVNPGPPSGVPSGPRDGRGRGFPGRGDGPSNSLRDAPPLTDTRDRWRADRDRDRDRDRDFERRDRRPSPRPRSPIRDVRDSRDLPRDLDIGRARRNSRDGPPSAGSTYSDPPLGMSSSYRGSGSGRGRGTGREFNVDSRGRGRSYHDDRGDHYGPRPSMYRPRSRSREPPLRREREIRDDRDFDRRDREERRFSRRDDDRRGHDSYIGPGTSLNTNTRSTDSRHAGGAADARHIPGTPTGPLTPHSAHHPSTGDRLGPPSDSYSRRSSIATEPVSTKDPRRESDRNDLLASRAEASRERYAPRASSPPAAVPAFGFSNVWRNPALDAKPIAAAHISKPAQPVPPAPALSTPATSAPAIPTAPKSIIPSGLSIVPPTGPKADRVPDRQQVEIQNQDARPSVVEQARIENPQRPPPSSSTHSSTNPPMSEGLETKSLSQLSANSPSLGLAPRARVPPTGPQAGPRSNPSPSFVRPPPAPYPSRDASPGAIPSGPRNAMSMNTSPKSIPVSIPTGPKADRTPSMAPRPSMYASLDRPPFSAPRMPIGGGAPKSNQWVRPGLVNRVASIPTKRDFPSEDRERPFGATLKAPKVEGTSTAAESQRLEHQKLGISTVAQTSDNRGPTNRASSEQLPKISSLKSQLLESRRLSDVSMPDASPPAVKPPVSVNSSAPGVMEDSDEDLDLDEADFAESEAKYNKEKALLVSKRIDLRVARLRATSPLQEIMLLASITSDHLPHDETQAPDPAEEEIPIPPIAQAPPGSTTTELLTPKAEETEDITMEETSPVSGIAPATRALRPLRELSIDRESTPDLSSLPWLRDGPPTPLSDLDQDRPALSEASLEAIRNKLRNDSVPSISHKEVLKQYADAYRQWRLRIRDLDENREHEEQERPQSAEPSMKVTTPDIQSSAIAAMMEVPPATTGRRGHSGRWATELDFEQVLKESLKTAEEERMGKKEKGPKKSISDPEREATLPLQMTEQEVQRRRFIDTNFQREPGQGIFVYHYEPPEDDFSQEEHDIMVRHYKDQYAKKWGKLAEMLHKEAGTSRTYKDCINHYYKSKWNKEYKGKVKRGRGARRARGGGAARGRIAATANAERPEAYGEDGPPPLALTDSGRPRRQAAPTFGAESELDANTPVPTPGRPRRQTDADGAPEKGGRRGKAGKEKGGRKPKNQPLAAAPAESPMKIDRKERALGVKMEDEFSKRTLGELTLPIGQPSSMEDPMSLQGDTHLHPALSTGSSTMIERPKAHANARLGPSSYWSVAESTDFKKNVAHFGTDWAAIANYMGTKTQTMVKNQYLRLVESGTAPELARLANEADQKRERGEDLGPPPTPTPAQKRRYESSTTAPRPLAPTPEVTELLNSPATQAVIPPKSSPPNITSSRFSAIIQAPQVKPIVPASSAAPLPESPIAPAPPMQQQQSPQAQPSRSQQQHHHHSSHSQHKAHPHGPRAGFFSDDLPPRSENRPPSQPSIPQPHRPLAQQFPHQLRPQEQQHASPFRPSIQPEREVQSRPEPQQEHEGSGRFPLHHARRISQDLAPHRHFQPNALSAGQIMPQMSTNSGAGSPETRPLPMQQPRQPVQPSQPPVDVTSQAPSVVVVAQQLASRSTVVTPPVKEEQRHYPLPQIPQIPQPQAPPQLQAQPQNYSQLPQPSVQPPPQPVVSKPTTEPKISSLLSLLNDPEPEEPRRKKPSEQSIPSHTPTPQQQAPIAPPPPNPQTLPQRREGFGDLGTTQLPYSRSSFAQQASQSQASTGRTMVDLTNEQPPNRQHPRDSWQQRQSYHPSQSQAQQTQSLNSPHMTLAQPNLSLSNHRAVLAQHNAPRHNPSPPPHNAYHSPHAHSRTPSLTQPPQQQPRHGISSSASMQAAAGATQILQPNPYAQVDPPGTGSQPTGPVGMRPSPHLHTTHAVQHRESQGRNEQTQSHNGSLSYSNPQTPIDRHPSHPHMRTGGLPEPYRPRENDFDARNRERDVSRELSHRAELMMRQERERDSILSNPQLRSAAPQSTLQDLRYQPQTQQDRGYPTQRSHTPLSRADHVQHPSLQHHPHSLLVDNNHVLIGQRLQEDPTPPPHRMREAYPPRDERDRFTDRIREEQAQQQARIRSDEYLVRERDARFREDLLRRDRDAIMQGPIPPSGPGLSQQGQGQRQPPGRASPGSMGFTIILISSLPTFSTDTPTTFTHVSFISDLVIDSGSAFRTFHEVLNRFLLDGWSLHACKKLEQHPLQLQPRPECFTGDMWIRHDPWRLGALFHWRCFLFVVRDGWVDDCSEVLGHCLSTKETFVSSVAAMGYRMLYP
ncbi:uncharacterized protein BDR25DRAFT_351689 [Lindgomyces ingoldianus]|uniref:Uncharacterized protein n=1 Tax=Lindgomyces ingoldianus TaxID=673940 RepID=A0ACB6R4H8_9PLEO|nr:uncharacterized protein BDR25DRAFT_351689 [Lindgomyces ingoldianus]KAF2474159.1 hypothetical protein BDR25DRAFT_351689 [Lindgomyces ingoldianus]